MDTMKFEQITEELLSEKLITFNNRAPYGQVVYVAGGSGSGKGFAISNFMDSSGFRIIDIDDLKTKFQKLDSLGKISIKNIIQKYRNQINPGVLDAIEKMQLSGLGLKDLDMTNTEHTNLFYRLSKAMGIDDKVLITLLMGKKKPSILPNLMFDGTLKDVEKLIKTMQPLLKAGYDPKNIHLIWVLTSYHTALKNNRNPDRKRVVPEDILLQTHEGAANTMWELLTKGIPKKLNGRVDVILNNPQNTVFYTDPSGETIKGKVKGFLSLPLKKAGGGVFPESVWRTKLFHWIKDNAPTSITANMKESISLSEILKTVTKK